MIHTTARWWLPCWLLLGVPIECIAASKGSDRQAINPAAVLDGAEARFVEPSLSWFSDTQAALKAELDRVGAILDSQGPEYAKPWKNHFYWEHLERNLGPPATINLEEIELSRRWLYSNRKGTEHPLFAQLRTHTDAYLDAAYTLTHPDLRGEFEARVALARAQVQNLLEDPTDENAAALGRSLGWFEKTGQLLAETNALRSELSHPNLQLVASKPFIQRIMSTQETEVEHKIAVSDSSQTPTTRPFQRPRNVYVRGTAHTAGEISLELVPNTVIAELNIAYEGHVQSLCHAVAGPVSFNIHTVGPVSAFTPVTFGPAGIFLLDTVVEPSVRTRVSNISAESNFIRRIGTRRVNEPESRAIMDSRSRMKTVNLLKEEMDERVGAAIEEIRSEIARMRSTMDQFSDVFAPVVREGAAPIFAGTQTTDRCVTVNIYERRREQFGAAYPCPETFPEADVAGQIHVSFVNNLLETIMAGKMFTDEYFMQYARVLQPTLPLDLMVHSRSKRWAIIADTPRPLVVEIPEKNRFRIKLKIAALEVSGERFTAPSQATVEYELRQNEFGDYFIERDGDVVLESQLDSHHRELLHRKLSAFLAPILDGGGVIIPEGGATGPLTSLELLGVQAEDEWLVLGYKVPQALIDSVMQPQPRDANSLVIESEAQPQPKLPPPYAIEESLGSYPGIR